MASWTPVLIPDQTGRVAIVTGASSGIGTAAAEALAAKGATVVLAVRNQAKGDACRNAILERRPRARILVSLVDLADLASVRAFAQRAAAELPGIDILFNNAGLGMQPRRQTTADGFERQFGTNHLGHFALTGLLMPVLLRRPAPRVVAISSLAHRRGRIAFDDLQGERRYRGLAAYSQSKLANLMFALELDRRARATGLPLVSAAAHPGLSTTGFIAAIGVPKLVAMMGRAASRILGQDAEHGAWPGLYAGTMPDVEGGSYWGPRGAGEVRGDPAPAAVAPQALDRDAATRLWSESERLTGVRFDGLQTAAAA